VETTPADWTSEESKRTDIVDIYVMRLYLAAPERCNAMYNKTTTIHRLYLILKAFFF